MIFLISGPDCSFKLRGLTVTTSNLFLYFVCYTNTEYIVHSLLHFNLKSIKSCVLLQTRENSRYFFPKFRTRLTLTYLSLFENQNQITEDIKVCTKLNINFREHFPRLQSHSIFDTTLLILKKKYSLSR